MKRLLSIAALALSAGPAFAQLSIGINEPGLYGRIDLGGFEQPQLLNAQPVYIERQRGREVPPPIYLHVPRGYERNWRAHCREYDACGQPVFFVRDDWYNNTYRPRYREMHGRDHGDRHFDGRGGPGNDRHDGPGNDRRDGPGNDRRDGPGNDRRDGPGDRRDDGGRGRGDGR